MILIDLDKHMVYEDYMETTQREIINEMFEEYFDKYYENKAKKLHVKELWKQISINIPEGITLFLRKNAQWYYFNRNLHFKTMPKKLFEINKTAHIILAKCFETCYRNFNNLFKDYKGWTGSENITIPYIRVEGDQVDVIDSEAFLESLQVSDFYSILRISFLRKRVDEIIPKIMELYRSVFLDNKPIMFIAKYNKYGFKEIWSISNELRAKKISFSLIERELEEIINKNLAIDSDFLVNRLYNEIMMPGGKIKPYIRIKTVNEEGMEGTLFTSDRIIPIVMNWRYSGSNYNSAYTFSFVYSNLIEDVKCQELKTIDGSDIIIEPINPIRGLDRIKEVNKSMFKNMTCYVVDLNRNYFVKGEVRKLQEHLLYKLEQGKLTLINSSGEVDIADISLIQERYQEATKEGIYAFFKVTL